MPTLLLIRHAQASFGQGDYDRLSELGVRQAEVLAGALAARGTEPALLHSGPRRRQVETASILGARLAVEPSVDEAWDEFDPDSVIAADRGADAPGLASPEIDSRRFQALLDTALTAWLGSAAAGSGADWASFRRRVVAALGSVAARLGRGEVGVVVTSAGVIAAVGCHLLALPSSAFIPLNRVAINTALTKVAIGAGLSLLSFNEYGHLEGAGPGLVTYR